MYMIYLMKMVYLWISIRLDTKYHITNLPSTLYWGLVNCIPNEWKTQLGVHNPDQKNYNISFLERALQLKSCSRFIYSCYLADIVEIPTAVSKWEMNFPYLNMDWSCFFRMPWCSTSDSKIQYFQFKFLHRIIPTNKYLQLIGRNESDLCTFCNTETETLEHLFWNCIHTSPFILDSECKILNTQFLFLEGKTYFLVMENVHITLIIFSYYI